MYKRTVSLAALLVWGAAMFSISASPQIIPLSSGIYERMEALYLVSGEGTPSNSQPWSVSQAQQILTRIDRSDLLESEQEMYDSIQEEINLPLRYQFDDVVQASFYFHLNGELYAHSNGEEFTNEEDWSYSFTDRLPMIEMETEFLFDDTFYMFTDLSYGRNRYTDRDTFGRFNVESEDNGEGLVKDIDGDGQYLVSSSIFSESILTNWMSSTYDVDFQTPKRSVIAAGGEHWNLSLSRDRMKWGNGHSGNFVIGDHHDYSDFLRLVLFSDRFSYDWTNMFFETNISSGEGSSTDLEFKMLMAHRLEFRILDGLTLAFSENVMYQNDVFDLRHFNPAYIYHNLNSRTMFNAIAHAELDVTLRKGLNLYGQYALDQAVAPNESATQADASAYLVGLEYAHTLSKGILSASFEYATTSPAMYHREMVDFIVFRKYHGNGTSFVTRIDYLGYEAGEDVQVVDLDLSWLLPAHGKAGLNVNFSRHGVIDYFTANSVVNESTETAPSGDTIMEVLMATVSGEWKLENVYRWVDLSLKADLTYAGKREYTVSTDSYGSQAGDFQVALSVGVRL